MSNKAPKIDNLTYLWSTATLIGLPEKKKRLLFTQGID